MAFLKNLFGGNKTPAITLYIMTFTSGEIPQGELVGFTRMFADRLSEKDNKFKALMALTQGANVPIKISAQRYVAPMHTPQVMQNTFAGWMKNINEAFDPKPGATFFAHGMKDPQGGENFVLFYFVSK